MRLCRSFGSQQQGLGLGRYIASEIAKAHGDRLDIEPNKVATTFALIMPLIDQ